MKINTEQQNILKKTLNGHLNYRETSAEFYDHILSALETKTEEIPFHEAVMSIIDEDFGGYAGMSKIEDQYKTAVTKEVKSKYIAYISDYFKLPLIAATLILALVFYWAVIQPWFSFWIFAAAILFFRMVPRLLKYARNLSAGYVFSRPKLSAKSDVFSWLDYLPVFLLCVFIIIPAFGNQTPPMAFKHANPTVLVFLLMTFALHAIAYFRIYKNEFKIDMAR